MTISRSECLDAVSRPGKYEGEPAYVPYFYDAWLEGCPDDEGAEEGADPWAEFLVTAEDRGQFPELADVSRVRIAQSDQGFVYEVFAE